MKTKIKTIDCAPTWSGMLLLYLTAYEDGSPVGRQAAKEELERMAKLADMYVASQKKEGQNND